MSIINQYGLSVSERVNFGFAEELLFIIFYNIINDKKGD